MTRVYESMADDDKETFRHLIEDTSWSGGEIARALTAYSGGSEILDRMAVDHYRRKLRIGKATL